MSNNTRNSSASPLVVENSGRWLGNDGSWSTFYVHAGTPPQHFHVVPSTQGQTLYVPIDQDCRRLNVTNCGGTRGVEVFAQRPSDGFQKNESSTWNELGIYRVGLDTNLGFTGNGYFGYDTVGTGTAGSTDTPVLEHQAISAYATPDLWLGQLGLSQFALNMSETDQPHSFLSSLKEQGSIPSLSFGYNAGAPYRFTRIAGSLTLGGYDRSRISNGTNDTLQIPGGDDLVVGLQSITTDLGNGTTSTLLDSGVLSVIDSGVAELWLPREACDRFASAFNLTYFEPADRYALTDEAHIQLQSLAPTISITIGTSVKDGDSITIDLPYAAFDVQASYPIFATPTNYFPIRRAANDSQYSVGRVFLQETYLTVDWERHTLHISRAHFSSPMPDADIVAIPPDDVPIPTPAPKPSKKLSAGAIAGIAIGGLLLTLLICAVVWLFKFRKRPKADGESDTAYTDDKKRSPEDDAPEAIKEDATVVTEEPPMSPIAELSASQAAMNHPSTQEPERPDSQLAELSAPHGQSEMGRAQTVRASQTMEPHEVEGTSPIYELPALVR
ncbi:aspartic peptidase domain-containing protein [Lophiotrema nucula]|uniref:Aspartic peptidase domain-containing protein n=1 Tax=Lophiotrema nucula TaxID=690887 RepID=A0A6A5YU39_9PLEO|nr:aspartic peptidase domain-containing protein [Lophiotrema nucula]